MRSARHTALRIPTRLEVTGENIQPTICNLPPSNFHPIGGYRQPTTCNLTPSGDDDYDDYYYYYDDDDGDDDDGVRFHMYVISRDE